MQNVSKQIYRELNKLLPDLQHFAPFDRVNLAGKGLPDINTVVFDTAPDKINFILGRHIQENGRTVANPCFEIVVNPEMELANVVTYKDDHYFHDAKPEADEIGTMAQTQANRLLYRWLHKLRARTQGFVR